MAEHAAARWPGAVVLAMAAAAWAGEPAPDPALLEFIGEWADETGAPIDPLALELALAPPQPVAQATDDTDGEHHDRD